MKKIARPNLNGRAGQNGRGPSGKAAEDFRHKSLHVQNEDGTRGARVGLVEYFRHQGERRIDMQLWNWRGIDVVNAHERDPRRYIEGMRMAASEVALRWIDPAPLYTHRFALEDLAAAFTALEERPEGFLKAWIDPGGRGAPGQGMGL